jgi:putative transposase
MTIQMLFSRLLLILSSLPRVLQSRDALLLENLALRQQLAVFKNRHPRLCLSRFDRMFWVSLRRIWSNWRESLIIVKPETVVRWHREGFRRYWRRKSRSAKKKGRPPTRREVRELIGRMAKENPTWGAPRIHGELLMLGIVVSERTVSRYLRKRKPNGERLQTWSAFLQNHRDVIAAMDFFLVPTVCFRLLYGCFVISHGRREILHANVTFHPTSGWVVQQLRESFPFDNAPKYLIFDRDTIFGQEVVKAVESCCVKPVRTSHRSSWQNGIAERWVGNCRRELLDRVIVFSEKHLRRLLREYVAYYNTDRCHYSLGKDTLLGRPVQSQPAPGAAIESIARLGGLHHRYKWQEAA